MSVVQPVLNGIPRSSREHHALIAADLVEVERIFAGKLSSCRGHVAKLVERVNGYRGKRLRPTLLMFAAHACGKATREHHILAAVVEMIHTATLVHDDVLDEARLRRHVPTVNADWGNHSSILLGDMLFSHAFHLAASVDSQACEWIGDATNRVCEGELHQVTQRGNLRLTEAEYFDIVEGKTAALTECCTKLGAIYAGADVETIHGLAEYGRSLGIAFQIADDLLDLVGMESNTGKTLGTDFAQQKLTLPLIHALDRLPTSRAAELRALLLECTSPGESLVGLLREANAIAYARNKADEFARTAREALIPLPESPYKTALLSFADWSVRREH